MPITKPGSNLLTPFTFVSILAQVFNEFSLLKATIIPIRVGVDTFRYQPYRVMMKTRQAPLKLTTPAECLGGLQFSHQQKRFVYRFDNCVLSIIVTRDEVMPSKEWLSAGALYLAGSVEDAQDLIEKLVQALPLTVDGDGCAEALEIADSHADDVATNRNGGANEQ